jgi:RNA polymerase sigma factor (sigma-70 family)
MRSEPESVYDDEWARRVSAGVAAGSRDALESLYRARFARLFRLVRSTTRRDDAFAMDCVHDAWMRVVQGLPTVDSLERLDRWLARAAMSAALDRLRAEAARRKREAKPRSDDADGAPSERASDDEGFEEIQRAIACLGSDDQTVLHLRFRGGLSLEALGSALGIGMKAAEIRVRRAVARLRRRMGTTGDPAGDPADHPADHKSGGAR